MAAMPLPYLNMQVSATVDITQEAIILDGREIVRGQNVLRAAYDHLGMSYAKFFKMDLLCRAGIIGVECIAAHHDLKRYRDDEIALVFNNAVSSLASDSKHDRLSLEDKISPSVFVYTLPNIVLGEISIRHKLYGEQLCTVSESPDPVLLDQICNTLMSTNKARAVILIHINASETTFGGKLLLLERDAEHGVSMNAETLSKILNDDGRA